MKQNAWIFRCLTGLLCVCVFAIALPGCDEGHHHVDIPPELLLEPPDTSSSSPTPISYLQPLTDATFDEYTQVGVVLVSFWRPGCLPCEMMNPILNRLSREYMGRVQFYKVNTLESPQLRQRYEITGVPFTVILHNGEKVRDFLGLVDEAALQAALEMAVARSNVQMEAYLQTDILVPGESGQWEYRRGGLVDTAGVVQSEEQRLQEEEQRRQELKRQILAEERERILAEATNQ